MARKTVDFGKPRRVEVTCPNCGKKYTLMPSEARKVDLGTNGRKGCCSKSCSMQYRKKNWDQHFKTVIERTVKA